LSQTDWICIGLALLGVFLFLYGANFYNAFVGWFGVFLFVGSIVAWIVLYVYGALFRKNVQKA